jgi:hypothetical protein
MSVALRLKTQSSSLTRLLELESRLFKCLLDAGLFRVFLTDLLVQFLDGALASLSSFFCVPDGCLSCLSRLLAFGLRQKAAPPTYM